MDLLFLNIGTQELMLIFVVALVLFGGKKLPELARGLGRGIREFKDASEGIKREISDQINNFEKDLDVNVEETTDQQSATKTEVPTTDSSPSAVKNEVPTEDAEQGDNTPATEDGEEKKSSIPELTSPEGTFEHRPYGAEVDAGQDSYYKYGYNDHFQEENTSETENLNAPNNAEETDNHPQNEQ